MNLRPYQQGWLDSMCAVYAVINAARIASWPSPRLSYDDTQDLFSELASDLATAGRLLEVVTEGSTNRIMARLLRSTSAWLHDNYKAPFSYRRPFKHGPNRNPGKLVHHLAQHLVEPHTAAIVALKGNPGHWTVVRAVTDNGSLMLFDSGRRSVIQLARTKNSTSGYRVSRQDVYFIRARQKN